MALIEKLFAGAINRYAEARANELARARVAETHGQPDDDEYAFRKLTSSKGSSDLPDIFVNQVLRESHWLYESHGLAERIIERCLSIVNDAGYDYQIAFLPEFETQYEKYADVLRSRLESFWASKDVDIQNRITESIIEVLLSGEQGWQLDVDPSNGVVRLGDFTRQEVTDIEIDAFDRRRLAAVYRQIDIDEKLRLAVVGEDLDANSPSYRHLKGDCFYIRRKTRASKRRGKPLLQTVIDEMKAEKKFRILSSDRSIARMSSYLDVLLKGMTQDEVDAYAQSQGNSLPLNGRKYYHNDQVEAEFKSANLESYELANMYRTAITIIAGMLGMPISWFGFGDGSTKATSETQQEPAEKDMKHQKESFVSLLEDLLYFVADQAILCGYVTGSRELKTVQLSGDTRAKRIRDCFTITVTPKPLAKEKPTGDPLAATSAAIDILAKDDLRASEGKAKLFPPEKEEALLNFALGKDGTGIELVYEEEKTPTPTPTV